MVSLRSLLLESFVEELCVFFWLFKRVMCFLVGYELGFRDIFVDEIENYG